jgi:hypothetical protein
MIELRDSLIRNRRIVKLDVAPNELACEFGFECWKKPVSYLHCSGRIVSKRNLGSNLCSDDGFNRAWVALDL